MEINEVLEKLKENNNTIYRVRMTQINAPKQFKFYVDTRKVDVVSVKTEEPDIKLNTIKLDFGDGDFEFMNERILFSKEEAIKRAEEMNKKRALQAIEDIMEDCGFDKKALIEFIENNIVE